MATSFSFSTRSASYVQDLDSKAVADLTQVLRLSSSISPEQESWQREQSSRMTTLPPSVLRPTSHLLRLTSYLPGARPRALLCSTHRKLSGSLIRNLFLQVTAEISTRLRSLTTKTMRPTLSGNILNMIRRLEALNSLWMSPDVYCSVFCVAHTEIRFSPIHSGCEACVLARVGGDAKILRDLYASCLSRTSKTGRRPVPRFLRVLEAWIDWSFERNAILTAGTNLALEMRGARKLATTARRNAEAMRRRVNDRLPRYADIGLLLLPVAEESDHKTSDEDSDPNNDIDFETDIIEYYSCMMSSANLPLGLGLGVEGVHVYGDAGDLEVKRVSFLHPAFRDSFVAPHILVQETLAPSRSCSDLDDLPSLSRPAKDDDAESMYSRSGLSGTDDSGDVLRYTGGVSTELQRNVLERAIAYGQLLGGLVSPISPEIQKDREGDLKGKEIDAYCEEPGPSKLEKARVTS